MTLPAVSAISDRSTDSTETPMRNDGRSPTPTSPTRTATISASLIRLGPVGIRRVIHDLPLHDHRRRAAAVEVEGRDEIELLRELLQLGERHAHAHAGLRPSTVTSQIAPPRPTPIIVRGWRSVSKPCAQLLVGPVRSSAGPGAPAGPRRRRCPAPRPIARAVVPSRVVKRRSMDTSWPRSRRSSAVGSTVPPNESTTRRAGWACARRWAASRSRWPASRRAATRRRCRPCRCRARSAACRASAGRARASCRCRRSAARTPRPCDRNRSVAEALTRSKRSESGFPGRARCRPRRA